MIKPRVPVQLLSLHHWTPTRFQRQNAAPCPHAWCYDSNCTDWWVWHVFRDRELPVLTSEANDFHIQWHSDWEAKGVWVDRAPVLEKNGGKI
ncbi:hypothetical protein AVEN_255827-1 [Araneus ventricosus]|uniref:Uncharacterized protein n=1 Tax=Araneus ventricosus TaxID=182803 RepID=A0A4Y2QWE7_ARAVE|nr:hypothetical protein AVEN_255827-1 [Araneus ventricosus]